MNWISVKERLPEATEHDCPYLEIEVIAFDTVEGVTPAIYRIVCDDEEDKELMEDETNWMKSTEAKNDMGPSFLNDITHWMPLPEPPECME
jgi:hypothetical protein